MYTRIRRSTWLLFILVWREDLGNPYRLRKGTQPTVPLGCHDLRTRRDLGLRHDLCSCVNASELPRPLCIV